VPTVLFNDVTVEPDDGTVLDLHHFWFRDGGEFVHLALRGGERVEFSARVVDYHKHLNENTRERRFALAYATGITVPGRGPRPQPIVAPLPVPVVNGHHIQPAVATLSPAAVGNLAALLPVLARVKTLAESAGGMEKLAEQLTILCPLAAELGGIEALSELVDVLRR
jgi:hypothetical protein